jgi:hypothetical protein
MSKGGGMADLRDRIKEFRRVPAGELHPNPKNWRLHPEGQRSAMSAMLSSIGFVGALVARETPAGLELLDGHLRADIAAESKVPVLIVDLSDAEADAMLATYDPLSNLALVDHDKFTDLMKGVTLDENAELRRMVTDLMEKLEKEPPDDDRIEVPGMALQPHEHYDYLVVLASTTHEWNTLCDRLDLPVVKRRNRMGLGRAIRADKLVEMLGKKKK